MVEEGTGVESKEEPANGTRKGALKAEGCDGCFQGRHDLGAQTSGHSILSVSVRVFGDDINIWIMDWIQQMGLPMWVGLSRSVEGLKRTKALTTPRTRQDSGLPALIWGFSLPVYSLEWNTGSSCWLLDGNCPPISFPGSPAGWLQVLGCISC